LTSTDASGAVTSLEADSTAVRRGPDLDLRRRRRGAGRAASPGSSVAGGRCSDAFGVASGCRAASSDGLGSATAIAGPRPAPLLPRPPLLRRRLAAGFTAPASVLEGAPPVRAGSVSSDLASFMSPLNACPFHLGHATAVLA